MVKGKTITKVRESSKDCSVEYRKIDALNVSSIKTFDSDPVKFYKQYILKQRRPDIKSISTVIGDIADFFLLECLGDEDVFTNRFDEKFALYEGKKGSGQVFVLADELFKITENSLNSLGEVVVSFEDRLKEAILVVQAKDFYKKKNFEYILNDFNTNGLDYFQTMMDNSCKTVVEVSLLDKARKVSDILMTDDFTKDVFQDGGLDYFPKFPIEWVYTTKGKKEIKCKSEIDILKIDHKLRLIYVKDLKTTFDNESFEYTYLKYRYDLQAAFYYLAAKYWAEQEGMGHYTVMNMEFIVGDTSSNNRRPVRYQTTEVDLDAALNGCTIRGKYYKGIHELIEEISWSEDNDMWNCSKAVFDADGILTLNLQYE